MTVTQTTPRPLSGARYVLERFAGQGGGELVYRGVIRLPDADIPIEVRVSEATGAATATLEVAAVPEGGPSPADLERTAAALVRSATKTTGSGDRMPPRKIVRWRG